MGESGGLVWTVEEFVWIYFGFVCGLIVLGWKVGKTFVSCSSFQCVSVFV